MTWILAISFLIGAAAWGYWSNRHDRDWAKAVLVFLLCTWPVAAGICPFFTGIRNPVYIVLAILSFAWPRKNSSTAGARVFHPALLCFLTLLSVSALWAMNRQDAALRTGGLLLIFAFVWNLLLTTDKDRIVSWLGGGLLCASYATLVIVVLAGRLPDSVGQDGRLQFSNELKATGTASMCMWAFVRLFAESMIPRGSRRLLHFLGVGLALWAMLQTGTRGTIIQAMFVLPLLVTIRFSAQDALSLASGYAQYFFAMLIVLVAVWTLTKGETKAGYVEKYRMGEGAGILDSRAEVWQAAMQKAKEKPWLGRGFGSSSFYEWTDEDYEVVSSNVITDRTTVHNQYVEIFYEFGVLGLLAFGWVLVAASFNAGRIFLSYRGPQVGLWRMLAAYVLVGMLEGFSHGGHISTGQAETVRRWILYCCVLALPVVSDAGRRALRRPRQTSGNPRRSTTPVDPAATAPLR